MPHPLPRTCRNCMRKVATQAALSGPSEQLASYLPLYLSFAFLIFLFSGTSSHNFHLSPLPPFCFAYPSVFLLPPFLFLFSFLTVSSSNHLPLLFILTAHHILSIFHCLHLSFNFILHLLFLFLPYCLSLPSPLAFNLPL